MILIDHYKIDNIRYEDTIRTLDLGIQGYKFSKIGSIIWDWAISYLLVVVPISLVKR